MVRHLVKKFSEKVFGVKFSVNYEAKFEEMSCAEILKVTVLLS